METVAVVLGVAAIAAFVYLVVRRENVDEQIDAGVVLGEPPQWSSETTVTYDDGECTSCAGCSCSTESEPEPEVTPAPTPAPTEAPKARKPRVKKSISVEDSKIPVPPPTKKPRRSKKQTPDQQ